MDRLLYILPLAGCVYLLIASWWTHSFFRNRDAGHLSGEEISPSYTPPVSILKPVRGLDREAYENFATFCRQDYPEYEVLFAVADPADPAAEVVKRLRVEFPDRRIRLLEGVPQVATNPKVSSLKALTREASHDVLVVSDSDMRVTPDYLRRVVAPMRDGQVGMVTCCYRGLTPSTFTAKLEALHMGVTFLPQVMVARRFLDMNFALGATMVLRESDLAASGGWDTVGSYLAEDGRLATQLIRLGKRVVLSDYIVEAYLGSTTWREQWDREVRWARTNRVSRPREYAGILLTLAVPLALVMLPIDPLGAVGWGVVGGALLVRWASAWFVTGYTGNRSLRRFLGWLPLRDLLSALTWCAGVAGRRVVWRGQIHRLHMDGRLEAPTYPRPARAPLRLLRARIDALTTRR